jgi:cation transport protein ChaC
MTTTPTETWIFGYGSLMWNPGFAFAEARRARLTGYHRAFCVYSIHYRGTERQPGLVLGLDRGGVCEGLAFRIAPERWAETLAYLRRRELIYGVYRETLVPLELVAEQKPDPTVWALTYIAERAHPAYAGRLPLARTAHLIRRSAGRGGTNLGYLASTCRHLAELGIREPGLERLVTMTGTLAVRTAQAGSPGLMRRPSSLVRAWAARATARPRMVRDNRFGYRAKMG